MLQQPCCVIALEIEVTGGSERPMMQHDAIAPLHQGLCRVDLRGWRAWHDATWKICWLGMSLDDATPSLHHPAGYGELNVQIDGGCSVWITLRR